MANVKILSDSTCDLSKELIAKYDIGILPLYVNLAGQVLKDNGVDINSQIIYDYVDKTGILPGTIGVPVEDFKAEVVKWRELGYDVVLLYFTPENHFAVGIKVPTQYGQYHYQNNSYAFIESTNPSISTNIKMSYGGNLLNSTPIITKISNGDSFDRISEEYNDAKLLMDINEISKNASKITLENTTIVRNLINKYCLGYANDRGSIAYLLEKGISINEMIKSLSSIPTKDA